MYFRKRLGFRAGERLLQNTSQPVWRIEGDFDEISVFGIGLKTENKFAVGIKLSTVRH